MKSPEAKDLNNDAKVDVTDYKIWVESRVPFPTPTPIPTPTPTPVPDFDTWMKSPEAKDLNKDGKLDIEDYRIWVASQPIPLPTPGPGGEPIVRGKVIGIDLGAKSFKGEVGPE